MASPHLYVRSTDGSDADNGTTWALAKATVAGALAIDSTTDNRIWVSQSHNESIATGQAWNCAGTAAIPTWIVAANDGAEPPTAVSTATVTTTGTSNISINGYCYVYGLTINAATTGNALLNLSESAVAEQTYENCSLKNNSSGSAAHINLGASSNAHAPRITWINVGVGFASASAGIAMPQAWLEWNGGSVLASPDLTSGLIRPNGNGGDYSKAVIRGVDLVEVGVTGYLVGKTTSCPVDVVFYDCKLPAFTTGGLVTGTLEAGDKISLYNCDSADTNYRLWIVDQWGTVTSDTSVYNDAGVDDGSAQGFSWKMVSGANTEFPHQVLVSPEIVKWNDTTTGTLTATVEIVHSSQGTGTNGALLDSEIWLEVMCMDPGATPVGKWQSDRCANLNLNGDAVAQTTSTASWTGDSAGWDTQKLVVSFTPKEKGFVHARVCLAKASATVYVDPLLTIA